MNAASWVSVRTEQQLIAAIRVFYTPAAESLMERNDSTTGRRLRQSWTWLWISTLAAPS